MRLNSDIPTKALNIGALGHVRKLEAGEDLNNILDIGTYYATASVASGMLNSPFTSAHHMIVIASDNDKNRILQICLKTNPSITGIANPANRLFYRTATVSEGAWGDWERLATKSEIDALELRVTALESK